jgi:pimeloyl-ACP methyl ester carboxylesterase
VTNVESIESSTTSPQTDLLCIHGFNASWHNWDPVVNGLRRHHRVHVARLAGHADGPALPTGVAPTGAALADQLERDLDSVGVERAHLVGNSLGGWLALELAARGRALSVTALSPALGWEPAGMHLRTLALKLFLGGQLMTRGAPLLPVLLRSALGRRALLKFAVAHGDRVSTEAALDFTDDMAECTIFKPLKRWLLDAEHTLGPIDCPVHIAWAELDALIPLHPYAARFSSLVPHAKRSVLPDVGHVAMYDDPGLVIRTVLEMTGSVDSTSQGPA